MKFIPSSGMKITLYPNQYMQLSSKEKIMQNTKQENVIAYDIIHQDEIIGFAMLRKYDSGCYFLWNFAIDKDYQKQGLGKEAFLQLMDHLKEEDQLKEISTTYLWGNESARHLYESIGFVETDVIDEPDCHEVNMLLTIQERILKKE